MSIENKRRVPNFTPSEKAHLMKIVASNFASVLEDKKTDSEERAWKSVEKAFNASSSSSIYLTALSLKKCYENRKKELKKTLADEKRAVTLTGGGPPPKDFTILLIMIPTLYLLSSLNKRQMILFLNMCLEVYLEHQFQNRYQLLRSSANLRENAELINSGPEPSSYETNAWKKYTPCQLQCPLSAPLASQQPVDKKDSSRRRPATIGKPLTSSDIAKKYDLLMDKRLELIKVQLQHTKKHNDLTIQKPKLELEILKVELAKKKKEQVAENT
ncbi:hypothetical protein NQ318_017870 [Aromia moschata]|uniref:Regulatory protein zeste n=1 Tax=Aromia moschata TaxID=1265417 RepID=A0AAV8X3R7_9CUCU|nr:hypothetical protein NQ318_017870 [Aromia moschata]